MMQREQWTIERAALEALKDVVAEFDAESTQAAMEPGCAGLNDTAGISLAREVLKRADWQYDFFDYETTGYIPASKG